MRQKLFIDIETYSSFDIKKTGHYRYVESPDFEIMLICWALNDGPVHAIDLMNPDKDLILELNQFWQLYENPHIEKHSHNATFERNCFDRLFPEKKRPISEWYCTAIKSAYCGLPLSLGQISDALNLGEIGKKKTGKALIRYFCMPCKPTKTNGGRTRNLPEHAPEKWNEFIDYCVYDVKAERTIDTTLEPYVIPDFERNNYIVDQKINDRGVKVNMPLVQNAIRISANAKDLLIDSAKLLTGLGNPNSLPQLKGWIKEKTGVEVKSLAKDKLGDLLSSDVDEDVKKMLTIRRKLSKASVKKYDAMLNCVCDDGRIRGLLQFYGASRTGRWAGRLVQVQNLPRNKMEGNELGFARDSLLNYSDIFDLLYDDTNKVLSELIRTAFEADGNKILAVSDFSAIEARVLAWLAGEKWRLEVFETHGKIYEASASQMFGVPIDEITKGSDLRQKGKVAELALGYQGGHRAMETMGGAKMGLSEEEMKQIVKVWRRSNKAISNFWYKVEKACKQALIMPNKKIVPLPLKKRLGFLYDGKILRIYLPSGRHLSYWEPVIKRGKFGKDQITYMGVNQTTRKWERQQTYGGKLTENIVQAVARDMLAHSLHLLDRNHWPVVMSVHDEAVCEVGESYSGRKKYDLDNLNKLMSIPPGWAADFPLKAAGFISKYYMKD